MPVQAYMADQVVSQLVHNLGQFEQTYPSAANVIMQSSTGSADPTTTTGTTGTSRLRPAATTGTTLDYAPLRAHAGAVPSQPGQWSGSQCTGDHRIRARKRARALSRVLEALFPSLAGLQPTPAAAP